MLIIIYSPEGETISDFEVENWVNSKINEYKQSNKDLFFYTSNSLTLDYLTLRALEGAIDIADITIYYNNKHCYIHPYRGLCFLNEDEAEESFTAKYTMAIVQKCFERIKERNYESV